MSERPVYLLDTNILLRFLTNDHPKHGLAAKQLLEQAAAGQVSLKIPLIAVAETIFTLQSYYKVDRGGIGRELLKILTAPGISLSCPGWVLEAVETYRSKNVSFGDACLAAEARAEDLPIASFDHGLDKFPGLKRFSPDA